MRIHLALSLVIAIDAPTTGDWATKFVPEINTPTSPIPMVTY